MPSVDDDLWPLWSFWPAALWRGRRKGRGGRRRSRPTVSSTTTTSSRSSRSSPPYSATTMFFSGPLGVLLFRCLITAMAYDKKFVTQL